VILVVPGAQAQITVLDQPGPVSPQNSISLRLSDAGCDSASGAMSQASMAENFVVSAPVNVTAVSFEGAYLNPLTNASAPLPPTSSFTLILHANSSAVPGAVVATLPNVAAARTFLFTQTWDIYRFAMTIPPTPVVAGTYWLEIFTDTTVAPAPGCFYWVQGALDTSRGILNYAEDLDSAPGDVWSAVLDSDVPPVELSLVVTGEATSIVAIPTLGVWGLGALGAALAGLAGRRLRGLSG
jgi:hypothetical protein